MTGRRASASQTPSRSASARVERCEGRRDRDRTLHSPSGPEVCWTPTSRPGGAIRLVACQDCDLLHRLVEVPEGGAARCRRCWGLLRRRPHNGLERTLALALAAAILFVVANSFPFLSFEMSGRVTQTTLVTGVVDLYQAGKQELAALVLLTVVLAPLTQILLLLYVLVPLRWNRVPWGLPHAFRLLRHSQPWSMMEVFMIGILVAIVKLMSMATIVPGLALWSFVLLILVLSGAVTSFEPEAVWERLEKPS